MPASTETGTQGEGATVAFGHAAVDRITQVFSGLTPSGLHTLDRIYHAQARFVDPFNEVHGIEAIRAVFDHMYRTLGDPRFVIRQTVLQNADCMVLWDFHYRLPAASATVHALAGASHLRLDAQGLITDHVDYWDPARGIYEKLPVIGSLARALRRRAAG